MEGAKGAGEVQAVAGLRLQGTVPHPHAETGPLHWGAGGKQTHTLQSLLTRYASLTHTRFQIHTHTDTHTYKAATTPTRVSIHTGTGRHVTEASPERHTNSDTDTLTHTRHVPAFTQRRKSTHTRANAHVELSHEARWTRHTDPHHAHRGTISLHCCLSHHRQESGPRIQRTPLWPLLRFPSWPRKQGLREQPVQPGPGGACS